MGNVLTRPNQPSQDAAIRDRHEWSTMAILAVSVLLGVGGGILGADIAQRAPWSEIVIRLGVVVAGFILAAAAVRGVEILALNADMERGWHRFANRSAYIRERMEMTYPGVSERAREISAERLVGRAVEVAPPEHR